MGVRRALGLPCLRQSGPTEPSQSLLPQLLPVPALPSLPMPLSHHIFPLGRILGCLFCVPVVFAWCCRVLLVPWGASARCCCSVMDPLVLLLIL